MGEYAFGQPVRRKEDHRLLTGEGRFTDDHHLPGECHAAMLRSPHAHARVIAIDTKAAGAAPGVLIVLTGADYHADGLGGVPSGSALIKLPGTRPEHAAMVQPPHPAVVVDRVRFVGDTVAVVVAETADAARDALELIEVEYEALPAVTDTAAAARPGAPQVWDDAPGNISFRWSAGDAAAVDAAFARADRIVELDVVNNRVVVGAMETRGAIGDWDPVAGKYTLHTGTQMPHGVRDALADEVFRVPSDRVRVVVADVGGSFGIKNALYPEQVVVLWAARRLGRPVRWVGDRADGFLTDYHARDNVTRGSLALDREGNFLALRVETLANLGAYLAPKGQLSPTSNTPALAGVYRTPEIHVAVTGVFTHTVPTEVYRGAGRPEAIYLVERLVDEAARQTGIDPVELRRRNLVTPAELPFKTALGLTYDSGDFAQTLDTALLRADRKGLPARRDESAGRGKLRGMGLAHYCERVAGGWSEAATLVLGGDGTATVFVGTMSNGQGHETAFAQLVAEQLGLSIDAVEVVQGDTDRIATGHGTGGSASISIAGAAVERASHDIIRQASEIAGDLLEAAVADIEFGDGQFTVIGTDRAVGMTAVTAALGKGGLPASLTGNGFWQPSGPTFPNGCHIAEVEVDPETGVVSIERYTMVHDFGRVLNPPLLEGQLQGGVAQGLGQAGFERVVYDPASGQLLSGSLMDYCLPRADDLPALTLETVATAAPSHPLGMKGCGEAGAAGAPPALINAILDALAPLGVRSLDMPATPERVWRAIQAAGR
ncbi:MAG TPA: xanthine dehydrogenase family protein molybdopterin-binding subunit [Stellaceae bacterium]|nr:xanthine dehydrogenase family protein molybdopterin-binding subunit [Stellaceae bacterium]